MDHIAYRVYLLHVENLESPTQEASLPPTTSIWTRCAAECGSYLPKSALFCPLFLGHLLQSQKDMATSVYLNPLASSWRASSTIERRVKNFHESLPSYNNTPLVSLDAAAKELGIAQLLVKDESSRFGLPAFKILGASWAIYRGVAQSTRLPLTASLAELGDAARVKGVRLVSCSEGNWGRAVARMAKLLNISATIYVPKNCHEATIHKIANEGAKVLVVDGNYDASIKAARTDAENTSALLVMDTSWPGYEEVPAVCCEQSTADKA